MKRMRAHRGQSSVELVCALIVFTTLLLGLVDVTSIMLNVTFAEKALRNAARVAATQHEEAGARAAAEKSMLELSLPAGIRRINIIAVGYNRADSGIINLTCRTQTSLPVPIAGWDRLTLTSRASEPITAFLSENE